MEGVWVYCILYTGCHFALYFRWY